MDKIKRIFIIVTVVLVILPLTNSCHKYPDDSFLSLRRPEKRILGSYKLIHYYVNGADSVGNPKYHFYASGNRIILHHNISITYQIDNGSYIGETEGGADFRDNKRSIFISLGDPSFINSVNIFVLPTNIWKVLKLYDKDFWLSSTVNGVSYEIHLKK